MKVFRACLLGVTAMSLLGATPALAKAPAKCVRAGGSAHMLTQGLAEFMAKAALKNSIAGKGMQPVGAIKLTCKSGLPVYCLARQKACRK